MKTETTVYKLNLRLNFNFCRRYTDVVWRLPSVSGVSSFQYYVLREESGQFGYYGTVDIRYNRGFKAIAIQDIGVGRTECEKRKTSNKRK